jgi:hypothetical protein
MKKLALILALVAGSASAQEIFGRQLYDTLVANSAAADTGILDVSQYRCALVIIYNAGAAATGNCVVNAVSNAGTAYPLMSTFTVGNGATSFAASVCPGVTTGTAPAGYGIAAVLPKRISVTCAANTNGRPRIIVHAR